MVTQQNGNIFVNAAGMIQCIAHCTLCMYSVRFTGMYNPLNFSKIKEAHNNEWKLNHFILQHVPFSLHFLLSKQMFFTFTWANVSEVNIAEKISEESSTCLSFGQLSTYLYVHATVVDHGTA